MLTLLQMVQQAEGELGLPVSTAAFGGDATGAQMAALANRVLDELRRMNRWTQMQFEYDIVVAPPITVTGTTTINSAVITGISPSTAGILPNSFSVSGSGLPAAARVISVDSLTQVTLNMEATSGGAPNNSLIFSQDTYPMPVGFDWMNNRTMWDRTNRWELLGPDSPQMDQWHRSGIVVTGPRRHFRQIGPGVGIYANQFRIWPAPTELTNPLQLVFEYLSTAAVNVGGVGTTFAQFFTQDSDIPLLDDQAIIMGIKWMFWEAKGFGAYTTLQNRWVDYVERLIARDGAAPTLSVVKRVNPIFISPANVQDGFFPGPVGPNSP